MLVGWLVVAKVDEQANNSPRKKNYRSRTFDTQKSDTLATAHKREGACLQAAGTERTTRAVGAGRTSTALS
jgi:hypothetical protein